MADMDKEQIGKIIENASNCSPGKAPIFGISRLRTGTDGPGITTLVAFMRCPLRCRYCLNDVCHGRVFDAAGTTPHNGIMMLTPQELYDRVKIDNIYFQSTGGGICFGGGEPTMYARFIEEFRRICGRAWSITLETSLHGCSSDDLRQLAMVVDHWIVDVKDMNPEIYERYTKTESLIAQNLTVMKELGLEDKTVVMVPYIPNYNTDADVRKSIERIKAIGFTNIEESQYYLPVITN